MKRKLFPLMLCTLLLSLACVTNAFAASFSVGTPTETNSLVSSEVGQSHHDWYQVTTSGETLTITGETPMKTKTLSLGAQTVDPTSSQRAYNWLGYASVTNQGSYYSYSATVNVNSLPNSSNNDGALPAEDYVALRGFVWVGLAVKRGV